MKTVWGHGDKACPLEFTVGDVVSSFHVGVAGRLVAELLVTNLACLGKLFHVDCLVVSLDVPGVGQDLTAPLPGAGVLAILPLGKLHM